MGDGARMENLAYLFCFPSSFPQSIFLPCTWLCLWSRLSWFCSPSFVAGGFPLFPFLSFRVTQILLLSHVQGVGLPAATAQIRNAEDTASCFADSVCIVQVSVCFTIPQKRSFRALLNGFSFLADQDTGSSSPFLHYCWSLGIYRRPRSL